MLLIVCSVALVVVQALPYHWYEGIERPEGFPYVAPYVQTGAEAHVSVERPHGFPYVAPYVNKEKHVGVERPYGFPYVAPYVQAPYAGYVPGYHGNGFPYHHNYFPYAQHVPHDAHVYVGHFKGKFGRLLIIWAARNILIPNNTERPKLRTKSMCDHFV